MTQKKMKQKKLCRPRTCGLMWATFILQLPGMKLLSFMHLFFYSVFLWHLCASYFDFILNFRCWLALVFDSWLSSVPKAGFLLGFKSLLWMLVAPPLVLSWGRSSCPPVSDWRVINGSQPGIREFLQWALHGLSLISCCFSLPGIGILTSPCLIHAFCEALYFSQWVHSENNLTAECQQGFPVCEWLLNSLL